MDYLIYHSKDLDGIGSAAVALLNKEVFEKSIMIGFDYNEKLDIRKMKNKTVLMVDVSLPIDKMFSLAKNAKELIFVDHHKSAFDNFQLEAEKEAYIVKESEITGLITLYQIEDISFSYYYSTVLAGCELMLKLFGPKDSPVGLKQKINLLGQYDTWRNTEKKQLPMDYNWEEEVLPFQWGSRLSKTPQELSLSLVNDKYEYIIDKGLSVLAYQKNLDERNMENNSFEFDIPVRFENEDNITHYRVLALNGGPFNSKTFEGFFHEEVHDLMMPFVYCGVRNVWKFSMYTTKDNVQILNIAKGFGGGGHKQACGFEMKSEDVRVSDKGIEFLPLIVE